MRVQVSKLNAKVEIYLLLGLDHTCFIKARQLCWVGFIAMLMSVCVCLLTRYLKNYLSNRL